MMNKRDIENKIDELQEKREMCEVTLNDGDDDCEFEPYYKDLVKAYSEHILDLKEFLKLFTIQHVVNCPTCGSADIDESNNWCSNCETFY